MLITYIHQYFNTLDMPGSTRSYEMAKRLVAIGHEVHIITSDREGGRNNREGWLFSEEDGINVHWYPVPYSNIMKYRERISAFIEFAYLAARRAASIKSDVVFATSTPLTVAFPAVYAARRNKVPMVFEVRDLWPEFPIEIGVLRNPITKRAAKYLESFAYRNSARIVALSPGMKEGIALSGYPKRNIAIIPNGCELELFRIEDSNAKSLKENAKWLQGRPLVLYAGAIGLINGVDYLVRLAAAIWPKDPKIQILVIGDGNKKEEIEQLAEELGVMGRNFFMFPPVPKREIPYWLAAADIVTSTVADIEALRMYWMNSQNKFFDALAAGKAVAINYGGWQADLILENDAGLVLDFSDVDSSADKIVKAVNDKNWLRQAGNNARKIAAEQFDWDFLAVQLEHVLKEAVEGEVAF